MADPKVSVIYEIIDKASPAAKKLTDNLTGLGTSIKNAGSSVGSGGGASGILGRLALLGGALAAVGIAAAAAGAAIVNMAINVAEATDALEETAIRAGVSTEKYQAMDAAAKEAGSSAKELIDSSEQLGLKLAKQDEESGKAAGALKRLGVATVDASGKARSLLDIQTDIVRAASAAPDQMRAQGDAVLLLGANYNKLKDTIVEVDDKQRIYYDRMQATGQLVTDGLKKSSGEFAENVSRLKGAFDGMATSIATTVIPMLNAFLTKVIAVAERAAEFIRSYTNPTDLDKLRDQLDDYESALKKARREKALFDLGKPLDTMFKPADYSQQMQAEIVKYQVLIERVKELIAAKEKARVQEREQTLSTGNTAPEGTGETPEQRKARLDKEARERKARSDAELREYLRIAGLKEADRQRIIQEQVELDKYLDDEREKQEKIADAWRQKAEAVRDVLDPMRELNRTIKEINDNPFLTETEKIDAVAAASEKWVAAMEKAKEKTHELDEFVKAAAQSMQQSMSNFFFDLMQGRITNLVDQFKAALDRMVADALAAKLAQALFGDYGKTGQIGGWAGAAGTFLSGIFRAEGGPVSAGQPYIVGEQGPELIIPKMSGNVIPNDEVAGMMGGGGHTVYVTIEATDAASFLAQGARVKREFAEMMSGTMRTYNMR